MKLLVTGFEPFGGIAVNPSQAVVEALGRNTVQRRAELVTEILPCEFRAAEWQGNDCYITGENSGDILLFCPDLAPPRNRVVQKPTDTVRRLDRIESIFSRFAPATTPRPSQTASDPR